MPEEDGRVLAEPEREGRASSSAMSHSGALTSMRSRTHGRARRARTQNGVARAPRSGAEQDGGAGVTDRHRQVERAACDHLLGHAHVEPELGPRAGWG